MARRVGTSLRRPFAQQAIADKKAAEEAEAKKKKGVCVGAPIGVSPTSGSPRSCAEDEEKWKALQETTEKLKKREEAAASGGKAN